MTIGNLIFLKQQAEMQDNWAQAERYQAMIEKARANMGDKPSYDKVEKFEEVGDMNMQYNDRIELKHIIH
ncbi:hypothetical protein [Flavobacterium alkalisoli]|uniref:hypothetical protein n=1 Tax=Flavobacterium alkalisoli TaxID=2602769 RepID=UPI003A92BBEB